MTKTTAEGVTFEPVATDDCVGWRAMDRHGNVSWVLLNPSLSHQVNPDTLATADVFIYTVDETGAAEYAEASRTQEVSLLDFATPHGYVDLFRGTAEPFERTQCGACGRPFVNGEPDPQCREFLHEWDRS